MNRLIIRSVQVARRLLGGRYDDGAGLPVHGLGCSGIAEGLFHVHEAGVGQSVEVLGGKPVGLVGVVGEHPGPAAAAGGMGEEGEVAELNVVTGGGVVVDRSRRSWRP